MPRVAWTTDIHLDFLEKSARQAFYESVNAQSPDVLLIGGDIGQALSLADYLIELAESCACPVHFVLGNHDFYGGSIEQVRRDAAELAASRENLTYLTAAGVVELTPTSCLIGHDGWADARLGDYDNSDVILNDYFLIQELARLGRAERKQKLHALGDAAAAALEIRLTEAVDRYEKIVLLTHVPPFREACWYDGKPSNDDWLPHFACKAVSDVIEEVMSRRPDRFLTVLCGHTHGGGEVQIAANVRVLTGPAQYGKPEVQQVFCWD